jgi:hypothetical protein
MAPVDGEELQAVPANGIEPPRWQSIPKDRSRTGAEMSAPQRIPLVQFRKGQRKDNVMNEHLARFDKPEGVVSIGKAQEKIRFYANINFVRSWIT